MRLILFFAVALMASACTRKPAVNDLSFQAAERAAERDIATGRMRVFVAGTRGVSEVGVWPENRDLVARLPRDRSLPLGCTTPGASEAVRYADAYNHEIILYLRALHAGSINPVVQR